MDKPKAVLILSGKGGVGKTLVSTNIALNLMGRGIKTGLVDADFSASNIGYFLNLNGKEMELGKEEFHPLDYNGMEVFSISLLVGDRSVSMTGDQYGQILRDAVEATSWKAEYIVVDCPAGFSDELKTAGKVFADSLLGSIIVLQPAHILDARRALQLHKDLEMPILGLIENMSYYKNGDEKVDIFGASVVDALGAEYGVPVFGKIPLSMDIRSQVEKKQPLLTGEYAAPIHGAVDAIIKAKPTRPGFLDKLKDAVKANIDKLVVEIVVNVNKEVNIDQIQKKYGYTRSLIVRLNIFDDSMDHILTQTDWMIDNGKLMAVDGQYIVDSQIDLTPKAVKWSYLADHFLADGHAYNFEDALRLGHMRIYGTRSMAMAAYLMKEVFKELGRNETAINRLRPILELL